MSNPLINEEIELSQMEKNRFREWFGEEPKEEHKLWSDLINRIKPYYIYRLKSKGLYSFTPKDKRSDMSHCTSNSFLQAYKMASFEVYQYLRGNIN